MNIIGELQCWRGWVDLFSSIISLRFKKMNDLEKSINNLIKARDKWEKALFQAGVKKGQKSHTKQKEVSHG